MHFGAYGAYTTLFHNWAVFYIMQAYGEPRYFAANFVLAAAIGAIAGAPLIGFLSDRVWKRRRMPAVVFSGVSLTAYLLLALWNGGRPPLGVLYPLCFLVGLGTGAVPLIFSTVRDVVQPSVPGLASGLVNMGGFVSATIAQPLFGYMLDRGWAGGMLEGTRIYPLGAFQQGLLLCFALANVGFVGALFIKETYHWE
jgi:sugar phosphate permease